MNEHVLGRAIVSEIVDKEPIISGCVCCLLKVCSLFFFGRPLLSLR